jgi:hypothetical protein
MTKFVGQGLRLNLDLIRKIEFYKDDSCRVTWDNGDEERLTGWEAKTLYRRTDEVRFHDDDEAIVPAAPGWTLITFLEPDEGANPDGFNMLGGCWFDEVIAWKICLDPEGGTYANQVAIGVNQLSGGWTCVRKDGHHEVYAGFDRHENVDVWLEEVQEEWRRGKAKKSEAAE